MMTPRRPALIALSLVALVGCNDGGDADDPSDSDVTDVSDATAAAVVIDSSPQAQSSDPFAQFTFHADDDATFECALDDGAFEACASPFVWMPRTASDAPLALGEHTFSARTPGGEPTTATWTTTSIFDGADPRLVDAERQPMPVVTGGWRGIYRINCELSHAEYDDPIVFPGEDERAHLHMFYGNEDVDHNSTAESLFTSGSATCQGGTLNRSAYWVPAVLAPVYGTNGEQSIDDDGEPMWRPVISRTGDQETAHEVFYYSSGVSDVETLQAVPAGLRMIAGQGSATPSTEQAASVARWHCQSWGSSDADGGPWSATIPECDVGDFVRFDIFFPSCWNGTDLDSDDHQSHMAYPIVQGGQLVCPTSHPEVLARVSYHYAFNISMRDADRQSLTSRGWRLASDGYDVGPGMAGGASLHGDWFNAWHPEAMEALVDGCLRDGLDCHDGNLANGRSLSAPTEGAQTVPDVIQAGLGPHHEGHDGH